MDPGDGGAVALACDQHQDLPVAALADRTVADEIDRASGALSRQFLQGVVSGFREIEFGFIVDDGEGAVVIAGGALGLFELRQELARWG